MAISVSVKKFSGREYVYICESFRDPITRRPTSRVLHSFGRKDKLLEENPNAMDVNFSQTGTHDPPKIHKPIGFIFEARLVRTGESFLFDSTKYYQIYDKIK